MHTLRTTTLARAVSVALALGLLAGCGPSDSPRDASTQPAGMEAFDEAAPAVAPGAQASLPDGFPGQFPLPADFEISEGRFTPGDSMTQGNFLVRGHSATAVPELAEFFNRELADAGFDILQAAPVSAGASSALVYFRGNGFRDCSVQLSAADAGTDLIISLPLDD